MGKETKTNKKKTNKQSPIQKQNKIPHASTFPRQTRFRSYLEVQRNWNKTWFKESSQMRMTTQFIVFVHRFSFAVWNARVKWFSFSCFPKFQSLNLYKSNFFFKKSYCFNFKKSFQEIVSILFICSNKIPGIQWNEWIQEVVNNGEWNHRIKSNEINWKKMTDVWFIYQNFQLQVQATECSFMAEWRKSWSSIIARMTKIYIPLDADLFVDAVVG